jgi:hypothetical protein
MLNQKCQSPKEVVARILRKLTCAPFVAKHFLLPAICGHMS